MLTSILLILAALIAIVLLIAAFRSPEFRVTRSITIATPPAVIFSQVNDFHLWLAWSPWEKMDPALKRTYSGAPSGLGAVYDWSGNKEVGTGRMTIVETQAPALIRLKLEFLKPMAATHQGEFTFQPQGSATTVTWTMAGASNYICRIFSLFINMDKMIGTQFEKGLSDLKAVSEGAARK